MSSFALLEDTLAMVSAYGLDVSVAFAPLSPSTGGTYHTTFKCPVSPDFTGETFVLSLAELVALGPKLCSRCYEHDSLGLNFKVQMLHSSFVALKLLESGHEEGSDFSKELTAMQAAVLMVKSAPSAGDLRPWYDFLTERAQSLLDSYISSNLSSLREALCREGLDLNWFVPDYGSPAAKETALLFKEQMFQALMKDPSRVLTRVSGLYSVMTPNTLLDEKLMALYPYDPKSALIELPILFTGFAPVKASGVVIKEPLTPEQFETLATLCSDGGIYGSLEQAVSAALEL